MLNRRLLVSDARHFDNRARINPYYHKEPVDLAVAQTEHDQVVALFEQADIKIVRVPSPEDSQDGVYTANWALVHNNQAIIARLPGPRKSEESYACDVLEHLGYKVTLLDEHEHFSGQGDALCCGDMLFCGSTYRSSVSAQQRAAEILGLRRIQLQTIPQIDNAGRPVTNAASGWPDSLYYDLDLALAIIREPSSSLPAMIAYCPEAFTLESQEILEQLENVEKIIVSEREAREAFACNLVSTGTTVIMSGDAPLLRHELERHGLTVLCPPHITELVKGGGFIRCISLAINKAVS